MVRLWGARVRTRRGLGGPPQTLAQKEGFTGGRGAGHTPRPAPCAAAPGGRHRKPAALEGQEGVSRAEGTAGYGGAGRAGPGSPWFRRLGHSRYSLTAHTRDQRDEKPDVTPHALPQGAEPRPASRSSPAPLAAERKRAPRVVKAPPHTGGRGLGSRSAPCGTTGSGGGRGGSDILRGAGRMGCRIPKEQRRRCAGGLPW